MQASLSYVQWSRPTELGRLIFNLLVWGTGLDRANYFIVLRDCVLSNKALIRKDQDWLEIWSYIVSKTLNAGQQNLKSPVYVLERHLLKLHCESAVSLVQRPATTIDSMIVRLICLDSHWLRPEKLATALDSSRTFVYCLQGMKSEDHTALDSSRTFVYCLQGMNSEDHTALDSSRTFVCCLQGIKSEDHNGSSRNGSDTMYRCQSLQRLLLISFYVPFYTLTVASRKIKTLYRYTFQCIHVSLDSIKIGCATMTICPLQNRVSNRDLSSSEF